VAGTTGQAYEGYADHDDGLPVEGGGRTYARADLVNRDLVPLGLDDRMHDDLRSPL
jgi:hypothetical protein